VLPRAGVLEAVIADVVGQRQVAVRQLETERLPAHSDHGRSDAGSSEAAARGLVDRYLSRVRHLPADTQEFLLLAAADMSGDLGLVRVTAPKTPTSRR
jgi:hypothetical protein